MLLPSDAEIPQNSLDSIPLDQQVWDDYNTGRVLVSALQARRVAGCVPPASTWSEYGPIVENEVATGLATTQGNLSTQAQQLTDIQDVIDLGGAYITQEDINTAPLADPIGSANGGTGPIYTPAQIAAATTSPVNNTLAVSFHPNRRRRILASRQGVDLTGGGWAFRPECHGCAAAPDLHRTSPRVAMEPAFRWQVSGFGRGRGPVGQIAALRRAGIDCGGACLIGSNTPANHDMGTAFSGRARCSPAFGCFGGRGGRGCSNFLVLPAGSERMRAAPRRSVERLPQDRRRQYPRTDGAAGGDHQRQRDNASPSLTGTGDRTQSEPRTPLLVDPE